MAAAGELRPHDALEHVRRHVLHPRRRPRRPRPGRAGVADGLRRAAGLWPLRRDASRGAAGLRALLALRGRAVAGALRDGVPPVMALRAMLPLASLMLAPAAAE